MLYQSEPEEICPRCQVGRIELTNRPYLVLHRQRLFTVPDATCYICDICGYHEFDDAIVQMMSDMVYGADQASQVTNEPTPSLKHAPAAEDELPTRPQPPKSR